jgi:hypothetical protein
MAAAVMRPRTNHHSPSAPNAVKKNQAPATTCTDGFGSELPGSVCGKSA